MAFTAHLETPVGWLEITASDTHIQEVAFLDHTPELSDESNPVLSQCLEQLQEYFAGKRQVFDLPLEPEGTGFQKQVWKALQQVPYGHTSTYLKLSQQLGNEKAIRAVGSANGQNPIAIIVPCHRIIGSDGTLTGYAGGLWRKQCLLELEQSAHQTSLF